VSKALARKRYALAVVLLKAAGFNPRGALVALRSIGLGMQATVVTGAAAGH
jgi:hypothetical protein